MKYSISGYLQKYYGCMNHEEGITLEEAYNIAWDNAQCGLHSVIESEAQIIYVDCSLLDENTIDIYDLIEATTDYCLI